MFKRLKKTFQTVMTTGMCIGLLSTAAFAGNPYAPYKGKTLVVNFPAHPHFDAVMKVIPKFTEETGIRVEVDQLQYLAMRQKQSLELTKPRGDYDLLAYVVFSKADYVAADQIEPLARFFMNPKLADPKYDPADLIDGYLQNIGVAGGKKGYLPGPTGALFGIPFGSETSVLGYRKDIFKKYNLKVPKTYAELLETSCKIKKMVPGMAGLTSRGASGHQTSHAFLLHLAPLGGKVYDDKWNPVVNNAAGVKAGEALKKILECGPEGGTSFGMAEMKNAFLQGKAAMFLDSTVVAGEVNNPEKSKIVGKVGWALHPKGVRRGSQTGGFGIAIPRNAQNKEAAFLLMQWLTSKRVDKMIAMEGGNPSRFSTHADPEVNRKFPHMKIFGEALKYADPDWRPIIPTWGQVNKELGTTLSKAMTGQMSVKAALDEVARRARAIQKKAGYYTFQ
ncbi:MAG: extracellular solute-binding protein [Deltaproteobacteria bacterium]|jgi:multiple sugar transport system substrate-binding protein|nr:extracellular solute-binding protein [Deltaproteobacteria bacterium]MBT4639576.1 extracellular solute-binding protein [Deltaproteobacteria bacterium]MBT6503991.1 extracellular solute-binding protein [Deltaproteobacteria bacterium]MBT6616286.1 extracellular solute-binding protein [Deltaproteobacteria bacterium]MBT7153296.1 extracellular solute-binding protein [Deltaproteobacteria bacterium]